MSGFQSSGAVFLSEIALKQLSSIMAMFLASSCSVRKQSPLLDVKGDYFALSDFNFAPLLKDILEAVSDAASQIAFLWVYLKKRAERVRMTTTETCSDPTV